MMVLGEALKAGGDLAGARTQLEETLAIRQRIGALGLVAENQVELASLAIDESRPERAEPLIRAALEEFEKEKADPNASNAYTLLSRALLMQGKLDDARKAVERGAGLSLTNSDPALKLAVQIQRARVESARAPASKTDLVAAQQRLESVVTNAGRLGYHDLEYEARLELAELRLKTNSSLAHKQLTALALEARSLGLELLARRAESAQSNGAIEAANHSAH
jgi:tetratricopeptide (TPR) repeat protein